MVCSTVSVVSTPKTTGTQADYQNRSGRSDHQTIWYCLISCHLGPESAPTRDTKEIPVPHSNTLVFINI